MSDTLVEAVEARLAGWVSELVDEVLEELQDKVRNYIHDEVATRLDIDTESALSKRELAEIQRRKS